MKLLPVTACVLLLILAACSTAPVEPAPERQTPARIEAPVSAAGRSALIGAVTASASPVNPGAATASPAPSPMPSVLPSGALQPITPAHASSQAVVELAVPIELWDRIRRGFAMPDLDSDLARQQTQWYVMRPEYIVRMTERSRKYLFHIVEEIERRGMPSELALLPFIESAFNPQAVSTAAAAGMWQFIPSTGKSYALKQNVFRDDRRDVLASTRAALDYLQKLYGMFGDWHLALAAYNCGEGCIGRAIARNQKTNLGTAYSDLNIPNETRNYVPKLQAIKNIVANPAAFRVELPLIENHPYFQTVDITRDIDVALAARLADVSLEDFKALNPSANRPVILAAGVPQILLPWTNANVFQRNFDAYSAGRLASWTAWTASSTMTVAEAARKHNMAEAEFRAINNIPPRMLIKPGSTLVVPRSAHVDADVARHVADNGQLNLAAERVLRRSTVKAGKTDTVASIAKRYRVSTQEVAQWNKIDAGARFTAGQVVVVYLPVVVKAATGARSAAAK